MRITVWILAALIAGCRPSATVVQTTPVASLQAYRTVALRVKSTAFAGQGQAMFLEAALLQKLQQTCGFSQVARAGATPADVVLDLNITRVGRGGGRFISNENLAKIETLLVLTDGQSGDIVGTARIQGESSGMIVNSAPPEREAAEAVAKAISDVFAKSGCSGPRIARAESPEPPPPDTTGDPGQGSAAPPDEARRAEAEALNEQGKDKLRSADVPGALAAFQQANTVVPDPRYQFNICLTYEANEQWDNALAACRQARTMNPEPRLLEKIDYRLDLLQQRKSGGAGAS